MTEIEYIKKLVKVFEKYKKDQDKIQKKINKTYDKAQKLMDKYKKFIKNTETKWSLFKLW